LILTFTDPITTGNPYLI